LFVEKGPLHGHPLSVMELQTKVIISFTVWWIHGYWYI